MADETNNNPPNPPQDDKAKKPKLIKVKARRHLHDGVQARAKDEVFETTKDVLEAFGDDLEKQ